MDLLRQNEYICASNWPKWWSWPLLKGESFFIWANSGLFYCLFSVFSNKHHYNLTTKIGMWNMPIQYTVPGFEPMIFGTWVSSLNHPRIPRIFGSIGLLFLASLLEWMYQNSKRILLPILLPAFSASAFKGHNVGKGNPILDC